MERDVAGGHRLVTEQGQRVEDPDVTRRAVQATRRLRSRPACAADDHRTEFASNGRIDSPPEARPFAVAFSR